MRKATVASFTSAACAHIAVAPRSDRANAAIPVVLSESFFIWTSPFPEWILDACSQRLETGSLFCCAGKLAGVGRKPSPPLARIPSSRADVRDHRFVSQAAHGGPARPSD